jgi:hypothetical protein
MPEAIRSLIEIALRESARPSLKADNGGRIS